MITIQDRGIIYDASRKTPADCVACFTGLCATRDGTVLCAFQVGPSKNAATSTIRVCRSVDQGQTWHELPSRFETKVAGLPGSLAAGEMVEVEPGRLLLIATWFDRTDPDRPLFDPQTEGILHSKQLVSFSSDAGDSWSAWRELPIPGLKGCSATGSLLKWSDGRIAYPFESYREYDDPQPRHHAAWLLVSRDGGRSFGELIRVAEDPSHRVYYWDQRLCVGNEPGEYIGFFWSHDLAQKQDLPVHFKRARIHDCTQTGRLPAPTPIRGQIAAPLRLDDGRLLAFVVDRNPPANLKLWLSRDGGRTWTEPDSLVIYNHEEKAALSQGSRNIDFKKYWEDMGKWSFGHPAVRPLSDGTILLAYYAGSPERLSIHWVRVGVG